MKHNLLILLLLSPLCGFSQLHFNSRYISKLEGVPNESYQGMDIWKDYMVSCQNSGIVTVYHFDGNEITKMGRPFHLGSYGRTNHSNVASFSRVFYEKNDKLPLLYVSQAYKDAVDGKKDVLYVERIDPDLQTSKLVQTICFNDINHDFGYALQWVIDRENNCLYGYGNTINNEDINNKHRIIKFRMPPLNDNDSKNRVVTLNDNDIVDNYLLEDTYSKSFNPIGQGLLINNGLLFMPTGVGKKAYPSLLYVWDLKAKRMFDVIDLSKTTVGELEDCAVYDDNLIVQGQKGLYKISFQKKSAKKLRLISNHHF